MGQSVALDPVPLGASSLSRADVVVALAWAPFAGLALLWSGDPARLGALTLVTVALSTAHQPLTLVVAHADPERRSRHRRVLRIALPSIALVAVGAAFGPAVGLSLVAIVGGVWNAHHTTMQRYGLSRRLSRGRRGDPEGTERKLFLAVLVLLGLWTAASPWTGPSLAALPLGRLHGSVREALVDLQPIARPLLVPATVWLAVVARRWWQEERSSRETAGRSAARDLYLGSTAVVVALAAVAPLAGVLALVGGHAVEYFVVVDEEARTSGSGPGFLRSSQPTIRVVAGVLWTLGVVGGYRLLTEVDPSLTMALAVFMGATHYLLDGLIWRTPRPTSAPTIATKGP